MRGALAPSNIRPITISLPTTGTYQIMWKSKILTTDITRKKFRSALTYIICQKWYVNKAANVPVAWLKCMARLIFWKS